VKSKKRFKKRAIFTEMPRLPLAHPITLREFIRPVEFVENDKPAELICSQNKSGIDVHCISDQVSIRRNDLGGLVSGPPRNIPGYQP
jgi:hypothetical protein